MKFFVCYKNQKKEIPQEAINKSEYLKSMVSFYKTTQKEIELELEDDFPDAEKVFRMFTESNPYLPIKPNKDTLDYFGLTYKPLLTEKIGSSLNVNVADTVGGLMPLVAQGHIDIHYLTNNPEITFFHTKQPRYTNFSKVQHIAPLNFSSSLSIKISANFSADIYKLKYFKIVCKRKDNFKISDYLDQISFASADGELITRLDCDFLDHYNNLTGNLLIDIDEDDDSMEVSFKVPIIAESSYIFLIKEHFKRTFFFIKAKQEPIEAYIVFESIYLDDEERRTIAFTKNIETIYNSYQHYCLKNTLTLDLSELTDHKISSLFFCTKNKVIGMHLRNKITNDIYLTYDKLSMQTIIPVAFLNREIPNEYYYVDFSCYQGNTGEYFNNLLTITSHNNNFTNIVSGYYHIKKNCELIFEIEKEINEKTKIDIYIKKEYIYSNYYG